MKKILLAFILLALGTVSIVSCTKEEVKPKTDNIGKGIREL
ncbi:MAG: hypothetical protein ACKVOQ_05475 [Cyclobacteriaceae bacterium]